MNKEQQLINDYLAGQSEAFGRLYDLYADKLYQFVYHKVWHKETAEDLTASIFMKAMKALPEFKADKAAFSTWLYSIARNAVIDHYRRQRSESGLDDALAVSDGRELAVDTDNRLLLEKVRAYLADLEPRQREVLVLRLWDGLSYKQIADIVGLKPDYCKVIFCRGVAKLRQELLLLIIMLITSLNI